jgi:hypothetical protein
MDMLDQMLEVEKGQQAEERIRSAYKAKFSDEIGQLVLQDMLWNLKFLTPCENEKDMALCNYAKSLLATIYGNDISMSKLETIFRKLLRRTK